MKIGIGLEYDAVALERLALAGLLHDAGMFALPEGLVMKAGALTPEERARVQTHPQLGLADSERARAQLRMAGGHRQAGT
ncbi:MAG: hypothetical protein KatS3mg082_0383 [Nitrospiraceae bacterium]|nr:MAG: hypothetical protein KatS3mg082_0383 [Nitrospiraceae bacterium]